MGNVVDWPALRDSAASDRSFISVRETGNTRRNTHGTREIGDLVPTPVGRAGGKRGLETNKGTRGLRCERDNLGAQPPPYHPSQGRVRGAARTTTMSAMRPLVAPGHAAPRVTQLARRRRPAGAARGNEMHSQLPVGSRRVGSGPRPARRAIVGTHEAPSHVANVSTGGSDSASQQPGGGGMAGFFGAVLSWTDG